MKLLFKLERNIETISNISVDDKCFPLIGGVHPYSSSSSKSKPESPLIRESALWFKTLVLDAIYVDCDRCVVFWASVQNDVGHDIALRKQEKTNKFTSSFIPAHAKPLFEDFTLFEFDPSLKEMMVKCKEVVEKCRKKSYSTTYINSKVANLLHVYILPSIHFDNTDLYALSRARCLIEERVMRADSEISNKAQGKQLLEVSLDNLKDNLIHTYNFESEQYLRTCDPVFLKVFLKKVEEDCKNLNLTLEAQQNNVNWAKEHPPEYNSERIKELQKKRDQVHTEVAELIRVRESLRNVLIRKEKYKRKKSKKSRIEHIESCYQSIFVEINRRWEIDMKLMDKLVLDKVNISGAREATLSTILELNSANRNSDRSTRFEPGDFSDCGLEVSDKPMKESGWLTLQERVSNILKDVNLESYKAFTEGCTIIVSQIDLALSEFHISNSRKRFDCSESDSASLQINNSDIEMRKKSASSLPQDAVQERRSGIIMNEKRFDTDLNKSVLCTNHMKAKSVKYNSTSPGIIDRNLNRASSLRDSRPNSVSTGVFHSDIGIISDHFFVDRRAKDCKSYISIPDSSDNSDMEGTFAIRYNAMETAELLSLKDLTQAKDTLKLTVHDHFIDVINCLQRELDYDINEDAVIIDMFSDGTELIWKAYERHFSEKVLSPLTLLYKTMLTSGITNTFNRVSDISLYDLLEGDKILTLFFNEEQDLRNRTLNFKRGSQPNHDTYSMARTVSDFSLNILDCSVTDLYALANADSTDVCKRFNLEDREPAGVESSSSSDSGASVKTSDLFGDEDEVVVTADADKEINAKPEEHISSENSGKKKSCQTNSVLSTLGSSMSEQSESKSSSYSYDSSSLEKLSLSECELRASERLEIVLSPFRKQMVKCIKAQGILDKIRYLSKAIEGLNKDISKMFGADHQSACDDIITMLIMAISRMPKDVFVGIYVNLNLLIDVLPKFLNGSLCEYNLVSLVVSYDYLKTGNTSQQVIHRSSVDYGTK